MNYWTISGQPTLPPVQQLPHFLVENPQPTDTCHSFTVEVLHHHKII